MKKITTLLAILVSINFAFAQPPSNDSLANKALIEYNNKNFAEAIKICKDIIAKEPENTRANYLIGMDFYYKNDFSNAIPFLTTTEKHLKTNADLYNGLAICTYMSKREKVSEEEWNLTKSYFDAALKIDPKNIYAFYKRALFTMSKYRLDKKDSKNEAEKKSAINDFNSIISIDPNVDEAYYYLALLAKTDEDFPTAIKNIEVILNKEKQPVALLSATAALIHDIYKGAKQTSNGIKYLKNCIERIEKVDLAGLGKVKPMSNANNGLRNDLLQLFYNKRYEVNGYDYTTDDEYLNALENTIKFEPSGIVYYDKLIALLYRKEYEKAQNWMNLMKKEKIAEEREIYYYPLIQAKIDFETNKGKDAEVLKMMENVISRVATDFQIGSWDLEAYFISAQIRYKMYEQNKSIIDAFYANTYTTRLLRVNNKENANLEPYKTIREKTDKIKAAYRTTFEKETGYKLDDIVINEKGYSYFTIKNPTSNLNYNGLLDKNGKVVVKPLYSRIDVDEKNELFTCSQYINGEKKWGLVNNKSIELLPVEYKEILPEGKSKLIYKIRKDENNRSGHLEGIFDIETSKIMIPCKYEVVNIVKDRYDVRGEEKFKVFSYGTTGKDEYGQERDKYQGYIYGKTGKVISVVYDNLEVYHGILILTNHKIYDDKWYFEVYSMKDEFLKNFKGNYDVLREMEDYVQSIGDEEGRQIYARRMANRNGNTKQSSNSNPNSISSKFYAEATEYIDLFNYFNKSFDSYKSNQSDVYSVRNWLNKLIDKNTTVINILSNSNDGSMSTTEQEKFLNMAKEKAEDLRKFSDNLGKSNMTILEAIAIGLARGARQ